MATHLHGARLMFVWIEKIGMMVEDSAKCLLDLPLGRPLGNVFKLDVHTAKVDDDVSGWK